MNIEALNYLTQNTNSTNSSNTTSNQNSGFNVAMESLLSALSKVNNPVYSNNSCCNNQNKKININIEKLEVNGKELMSSGNDLEVNSNKQNSLDILEQNIQSVQTSNKVENVSQEIKLSDKNSTMQIEKSIELSAKKYGVDADLVRAVIKVESNFNPKVTSSAGAKGLMQLMPQNYEMYGLSDPYDIEKNIDAGVKHLKSYIDRYDGDIQMGLMAYNGGPTRMDKRGVKSIDDIYKMPTQTQNYVPKVMKYYEQFKSEVA